MRSPQLVGASPNPSGMPRGRRAVRLTVAGLTAALALAGCANRDPEPAPAPPATTPTVTTTPATPTRTSTTTAPPLPGMPPVKSRGDSDVDASTIKGLDDLPAAFGCPTTVPPISIPATTPTAGSTAKAVPAALVCVSALVPKGEALYLWYFASPEQELAALTAAIATTKYVHAGPNWVAGGTIDKTMGTVGGDVYK